MTIDLKNLRRLAQAAMPEPDTKSTTRMALKRKSAFIKAANPAAVLELLDDIERLRDLLADAIDEIESWGSYVNPYFQEKWGLKNVIARFRAKLEKKP